MREFVKRFTIHETIHFALTSKEDVQEVENDVLINEEASFPEKFIKIVATAKIPKSIQKSID